MNYENVMLERSMYSSKGGITAALEKLDPTSSYKGSELTSLDAYQRQLQRFDIKVCGENSDTISKFFACDASAILFPEYVARIVLRQMNDSNILNEIIASKSIIDDLDYHSIVSTTGYKETSDIVVDGEIIPEVNIGTNDLPTTLRKRGRILNATYDAIKDQRIDVFSIALMQIGNAITNAFLKDAVEVLIGKENTSSAAEVITLRHHTVQYPDIINLWCKFEEFEMGTLLASPDMAVDLMTIEEFKSDNAGYNLRGIETFYAPLGLKLIKSGAVPKGTIIALDPSFALELISTGGISVDYDKLIDKNLERSAITATHGFNKIFPGAVKVLKRG